METRVFSLSSAREWKVVLGIGWFLSIWSGLLLWMNCSCGGSAKELALRAVGIPFALLLLAFLYRAKRSHRLEISDYGLAATAWQRKPVVIGWDEVKSVDIGCARILGMNGPRRMRITGSSRQSIWVSASCLNSDEIIGILRQRLPEEVFQQR